MNDKNNTNYDISKDIRTVQEANSFCSEIDGILESFYQVKNKNLDELLSSSTGNSTSILIKRLLSESNISASDFASCEKLLSQVRDGIKKMKVIRITLAIDPTDGIIARISDWINLNLEANTLIDIDKDESILGGAVLSINGNYKDFSLKKTLEDVFARNKNELIKNIYPK